MGGVWGNSNFGLAVDVINSLSTFKNDMKRNKRLHIFLLEGFPTHVTALTSNENKNNKDEYDKLQYYVAFCGCVFLVQRRIF